VKEEFRLISVKRIWLLILAILLKIREGRRKDNQTDLSTLCLKDEPGALLLSTVRESTRPASP
jgi:hypothetical protein